MFSPETQQRRANQRIYTLGRKLEEAKAKCATKTEALANATADVAEAQLRVENLQTELLRAKRVSPGVGAAQAMREAMRDVVAKHAADFQGKIEHEGFDESIGNLVALLDTLEQHPAAEEGGDANTSMDVAPHHNTDEGENLAAAVDAVQGFSAEARKRTAEIMGDLAVTFRRLRTKTSDVCPPVAAPHAVAPAPVPVPPAAGATGENAQMHCS